MLAKGKRALIHAAFSQLSMDCNSWSYLAHSMFKTLPSLLESLEPPTVPKVIETIAFCIPKEYDSVVQDRISLFLPFGNVPEKELSDYLTDLNEFMAEIGSTGLYNEVLKVSRQKTVVDNPVKQKMVKRASFSYLVPPNLINDYAAFLTLFLYSLIGYKDLTVYVKSKDVRDELAALFNVKNASTQIQKEVALLKTQLDALSRVVE